MPRRYAPLSLAFLLVYFTSAKEKDKVVLPADVLQAQTVLVVSCPGTEIGPSEDALAVYRGGREYPLDSSPVWRYMAKDSLRSPAVPAVDEFREAIAAAEKAAAQSNRKNNLNSGS